MEPASPARLYAAAAGALLVVLGIAGFFYSASFGAPGTVGSALGALRVNAWANLISIALGGLGLLAAGYAARPYALAAGSLFTVLAIWGFALDGSEAILGFLPAGGGQSALRLVLGMLGLAAAAATPKARDERREPRLEPRAQAVGKGT